ncbi:MAG: K(+)-insensitive pyrophosphate-energized proton pump [Anaerolineaceae bacterium]|jgi:K(+)-stimulated pyrophosphate-energized sodium pump|nr:K(+)-insensitive pyrophosphate-energized proton pump [Anaerolineales bacterium]MCC7512333.1 sodium-translocating pyrophosphatase [Anaerolineae bacterium]MCE7918168.1 sodium-translocating pyrophosphatase [Chloroflexi bacterium CFX1]GER80372.1 sodium-translocating pyrophosphatase [Candidatus Denitrolinea symbiosum]GIK09599.1 MAG: K(+)-insensitive pyrophosphate-energized proton pump [Chloroflexota bacterium]GJQ38248.1 MAG: K(+)-insensitive pyrophosphate-energized proton pump [Anaerolineaceae b
MFTMGLSTFETWAIWGVFVIALLGLGYAVFLRSQILREDKGTEKMQEVWGAIRDGANAYLVRQLRSILPLIGVLTIALFFSVYIVPPSPEALERFKNLPPDQVRLIIGLARAVAFIMGASFSLMVGQIGMRMAVEGNVRVASASRRSFGDALRIAYRAGTITGMLTDGLGLLGGTVIFIILGIAAPDALLGFGFGGTLLALFMRVGGGIFTKAADVGADLVGKVEAGIPEDDPRNPAVVADLVGDNVGDCAGMAADIFESYEVTIVSGLILGLALYHFTGRLEWIVFPLIVRGVGVLASIIGTYLVRGGPGKSGDAMASIFRGFLTSAGVSTALFFIAGYFYLNNPAMAEWGGWWRIPLVVSVGVLLAILIDRLTEYFTGTHNKPVKEIKKAADTGPATLILQGIAAGFESSVWSVIVIALTIVASIFIMGSVPNLNPVERVNFILYGVAMIGIGMLTLTGNNVAMDSFGPIADNANGIGEMSWHGLEDKETKDAQQIMADLDAVGNTTKAITKGIAIGSAVIAAVSLFGSFLVDVSRAQQTLGVPLAEQIQSIGIRVDIPQVFVGMLIGGALPWLFSSFAIQAVSRAASLIVLEVRRQFKLGVLEGKIPPDYKQAVAISTTAAQKELVSLALLGIVTPIVVGLTLQVEALGGFLAGIIVSGQLLAVFLNNSGGAWDNAKKLIEDEPKNPAENSGKGSDRHKAAVVGDTVGDPFKDTAGPALNPMIKVVNLVSVIIAPIVVQYAKATGATQSVIWAVALLLLALLGWAVLRSKAPAPEMK